MENLERILSEHPFLEGMDVDQVQLLVGCASNVFFQANEFLFREGEPADTFYFIRHGKVSIETHVPQREPIVIQSQDEGEILGWSWLVPPYRWHFDARAVELTRAI
ncbi:MAG: cyclic nucleotide-binding domain-containing protein, partial [candidate division Zixibacteria bacterium]|nr:cyclic nucleotide-binding domain-containing protein [candidate division Zixibacteria bacterium]